MSSAAPSPPIPWLGLLAVLLGTFISTLTGRLSSFGLADIRGAVHAGFDEGAWITSAFTVAQMLITPVAVWGGSAFGPRRILVAAALSFAGVSLVLPWSQDLPTLLVLEFVSGLASGCFIPLTLSYIMRNLPPRLLAYGIALYALNLELSLNISASLEGWYVDYVSWRWIFWQNVPLALGMAACLQFGMRSSQPPPNSINRDPFGLAACGIGLALIYAALDQGNRLDWGSSGLIWGMALAGAAMLAAFVIHDATTAHPWLNLRAAVSAPLSYLLVVIGILRLVFLATSYLIPLYLGAVRGFRALDVGGTMLWIAIPQLLICPVSALLLRRFDPRIPAALGLGLVGIACLMVADALTPLWGSDQFLPSQLLQAAGQSLALAGIMFTGVLHLRPQDALTFGAMLQIARLFGGEVGLAFIQTAARLREQRASNLIGQHLATGGDAVLHRLSLYARLFSHAGRSAAAAPVLLGNVVRSLATTQSVIDCFVIIGACAAMGLAIVMIFLPAPPRSAASHIPLFKRKQLP